MPMTDDDLIGLMLGPDDWLAHRARELYSERHRADPPVAEPAHCAECFEGCPRCQPERARAPGSAA